MVYIDNANYHNGFYRVSSMLADTPEELNAMATAIGLKAAWIKPGGELFKCSYYEVALTKKTQAIKLGALEVGVAELMAMFPASVVIAQQPATRPADSMEREGCVTAEVAGVYYGMPLFLFYEWVGVHPVDAIPSMPEVLRDKVARHPKDFKAFIMYQ